MHVRLDGWGIRGTEMQDLIAAAKAFLLAGGFEQQKSEANFIEMVRPGPDDQHQHFLIWSAEQNQPEIDEATIGAMRQRMATANGASGYYLVAQRAGLAKSTVSELTSILGPRGGIRTPIEFFDSEYKASEPGGRRANSKLAALIEAARATRRVGQPFEFRAVSEMTAFQRAKGDLVEHLETEVMAAENRAKLWIIEGSAGSGKTTAFNALAKSIYEEFMAAKKACHSRRRPIAFLPSHLRTSKTGYVDDVIAAVSECELADAVTPQQLNWLLINGYAVWMFDGLDEFYSGESKFLDYLSDALLKPESRAQVILSTRDSLFSSDNTLNDFLSRISAAGVDVEIYKPAPWNKDSWREMAWLELEHGRAGAEHSSRVLKFVAELEGSDKLAPLAKLPFYCGALLDIHRSGQCLPDNEFAAVGALVDKMICRERDKGVLQLHNLVDVTMLAEALREECVQSNAALPDSIDFCKVVRQHLDAQGLDVLLELLGSVAHKHRRNPQSVNANPGLSVSEIQALCSSSSDQNNLDGALAEHVQRFIVQFAFFGSGKEAGYVDFTHEIIADYLAAYHAVSIMKRHMRNANETGHDALQAGPKEQWYNDALFEAYGTAGVDSDSAFCRYLTYGMRADEDLQPLFKTLTTGSDVEPEPCATMSL